MPAAFPSLQTTWTFLGSLTKAALLPCFDLHHELRCSESPQLVIPHEPFSDSISPVPPADVLPVFGPTEREIFEFFSLCVSQSMVVLEPPPAMTADATYPPVS